MMLMSFRTTITLDEDVKAKVKAEVRRTGAPFKQIVNDAIRRGLAQQPDAKKIPPFKIKPKNLGLRPGLSYDCVWKLIEEVEGPFWK